MVSMTERLTGTSGASEDKPEKHLFRRVVHGGAWVFVLRIIQQVVALVRLVVLARILAPGDFGILGLALLTTRIARIFTETGFDEALVQRQGNIKPYLNAAWSVHVFRGLILFGLMLVGAPYIVQLLNNPNDPLDLTTTTSALRVISISFLLGGFANIGVVHFRKDMQFNKYFLRQICGVLVDVTVSIALLIIIRNVWALILGKLAGEFILFVLSYIMHPFRPRFRFDGSRVRELWVYGKWGLGTAVVGFLMTEGDDFLVLKILGPTMMGLYLMAHKIGWLPITEITLSMSFVTFPAYAKVQDNIPRLRDAYLKVLKFTAFLSFPLAVMIILLGEDFTVLFMKEKWRPMVPALQFLATMAIFSSLASCAAPLFRALGHPKIVTYLILVRLFFLAVLIYPLITKWGITGTAAAVLFSTLLTQPFIYHQVVKHLGCRYRDVLRELLTPVAGILVLAGFVMGIKFIGGWEIGIGIFFFCAGTGIVGYIIAVFGLDRILGSGIKDMIVEQLNVFRHRKREQVTK
jgi:lipopolysaccharide exporter